MEQVYAERVIVNGKTDLVVYRAVSNVGLKFHLKNPVIDCVPNSNYTRKVDNCYDKRGD